MKRSTNYTIAAVLQALLSMMGIAGALVYLPRGAQALNQGSDSPPYAVLVAGMAIGVLGLVSAWGVWKNKRWGVILTIILRVVDGLLALPGVIFAPTPMLTILSSAGVVLSIVVIALLLWPKPSSAPAGSAQHSVGDSAVRS